ncbi:universal stress protein [Amycolatopsis acidicola]|uniref:Universal stress protein n=1 Tax=Amycolatopsis acidicola TaxID=2596893 RepID=A0A5N0V198_9PSEU|nr:universal stress protein [Amycolatopsis acidicola]KAA9160229.1 universal stress protein [Amycolatopsis acidicola]
MDSRSVGALVVGVDGSASALAAVRWAAAEAVRWGLRVRLVHVAEPVPAVAGDPAEESAGRRARGEQWLNTASSVASRTAAEVETVLYEGNRRDILVEEAGWAAELVLGSRGRGGLGRLTGASAGLAVATHGGCPVVIVRGPARESGHVVAGVDDGPETTAVLRFAFHQALRSGTGVTALHSWRIAGHGGSVQAQYHAEKALRERVSAVAAEFGGIEPECLVVRGKPEETLLEFGRHARLIVVGTRGHGGLTGLFLGSVSQSVAGHGTAPVAVIRSSGTVRWWARLVNAGSGH